MINKKFIVACKIDDKIDYQLIEANDHQNAEQIAYWIIETKFEERKDYVYRGLSPPFFYECFDATRELVKECGLEEYWL